MRFAEYLERVLAKATRELGAMDPRVLPRELQLIGSPRRLGELIEQAHIFNLGDAEELDRAAQEILPDLIEECREDLPAPFPNMLVFCETTRGWSCEWHLKAGPFLLPEVVDLSRLHQVRFLIDLSEPIIHLPTLTVMAAYSMAPSQDRPGIILTPDTRRRGALYYGGTPETVGDGMAQDVFRGVIKVAVISHPANFVVRTSPKLTPHEERRRASKGIFPLQKKPHYIVIDHEDLLQLAPGGSKGGTHRSPTPHARRGHWRRLADRCQHARASGKNRVWVGDTYVGETVFEDEKNRYEVILNRGVEASQTPQGR